MKDKFPHIGSISRINRLERCVLPYGYLQGFSLFFHFLLIW